jgi:hypothetical protein
LYAIKVKDRKRTTWKRQESIYILKLFPNCNHVLPFQVNGCDTKYNSFEPKNHEEPLGKRAVSYAFTITASLETELNIGKQGQNDAIQNGSASYEF